ncbi:MAG: protein-export chaperone SecB [Hyphomicrobiales bacterium]|nr:protein-export chaperone SecB [Hyphomicrobiales bacterium]
MASTPKEPSDGQTDADAAGNRLEGAQLAVLAQFIKDLSFESPNAPQVLQGPGENPQLQVNVNVQATKRAEEAYQVDLQFEAQAKSDDGVIYNIEIVYSGMFRLTNIPEDLLQAVLFVDCPTILFPFLRRIVADLTQDGGFPPLLMDPMDFAALYRQNAGQVTEQAAH